MHLEVLFSTLQLKELLLRPLRLGARLMTLEVLMLLVMAIVYLTMCRLIVRFQATLSIGREATQVAGKQPLAQVSNAHVLQQAPLLGVGVVAECTLQLLLLVYDPDVPVQTALDAGPKVAEVTSLVIDLQVYALLVLLQMSAISSHVVAL